MLTNKFRQDGNQHGLLSDYLHMCVRFQSNTFHLGAHLSNTCSAGDVELPSSPPLFMLGAAPGIQAPTVHAPVAAAEAPAGFDIQASLVHAAAPAAQVAAPDVDPDIQADVFNAAADAPPAGLMLPNAAAPATVVHLTLPDRTLVNPTGTGRVPFVVRWAPGVCGVKLSEQHSSNREAGSSAVPRLQDMMRAVQISALIERPTAGDLVSDLRPRHTAGYLSLPQANCNVCL